jgi:hypothetical protein
MKHFKKTLFLFFLPALLSLAGCNNDDDGPLNLEGMTEQEIQTLFVGEWKEIERGNDNYPERSFSPHDYTFKLFSDGTGFFTGDNYGGGPLAVTNETNNYNYRIDSEYIYFTYGSKSSIYRYTFHSSNKLRLDYVSGPVSLEFPGILFYIYKRIKQ